ncbi:MULTISPECIES: HD-GYP domain-containing protein [unclassified Rhizobium]|uniref:HD-GYP domain-containing protein n=1 Tax=unclassified Rhizobium TaxID=2613769 RepID=UPI001618553C|nr:MULTISPECIES: HD-GYP domain-containing protein [unclassified Rhizobium]
MRKRIRLHQLRLGMFVEDVESEARVSVRKFVPSLISSASEIDRMMNCKVISVVINVRKGLDVEQQTPPSNHSRRRRFETDLLASFSMRAIEEARQSLATAKSYIHNVLSDARIKGTFSVNAADEAVINIMSDAASNAAAMIAIARLKEHDEVTFLHSFAVSALMVTFGRKLGLGEHDIRLLAMGGLVHDLGKMALPPSILSKTGKLTSKEMAIVRTHPQRGYELISRLDSMPLQILDICLYHHEKFDGSGYPHHLAGDEIPFMARIAAICDVYDALTTVRPYKKAWSQTEAINLMMNSPGHFDPDLLATFVSRMIIDGTLN